MQDKISIIIPCYNEQETIPLFIQAMDQVYHRMQEAYNVRMEYLFVDDGSRDNTLTVMKEATAQYPHVSFLPQLWKGSCYVCRIGTCRR